MIWSKTRNENYFGYLIMEIVMVAAITFIGVGLVVFYLTMRVDAKTDSDNLMYLFGNPFIFAMVCLAPTSIGIACLIFYRQRNYIVGFQFDADAKQIILCYRSLFKKEIKECKMDYSLVKMADFSEKKCCLTKSIKACRFNQKVCRKP
ncbi:MAG: hypothetical protein KJ941_09820 [Bacteroidetes bacterium]|nr:hypothetical protein [Bacteroidota bacterium]